MGTKKTKKTGLTSDDIEKAFDQLSDEVEMLLKETDIDIKKTNNCFFIRLGEKGKWVDECITNGNSIKLGFINPLHKECLKGEWEKVRNHWIAAGKPNGKATEFTNQIKIFYESDEDTMWITFFDGKLYWCYTDKKVIELKDGRRSRKVKGQWEYRDINGQDLTLDKLSGKLTQVQRFEGTICKVKEKEYLIKKINCIKTNEVVKAENTLFTLKKDLEPIIQKLTPKDFEILIDLIFSYAGWQRLGKVGGSQKSIDLDLMSPVNGNRAFVQIKSKSDIVTFKNSVKEYKNMKHYHEMYFVVHTMKKPFINKEEKDIKLWDVKKISELVVNSGLVNWVINKAS